MDKVKSVVIAIVAIISVVVISVIANKLLDTTGKVNQGNFRISDIVVESSAKVDEVQGDIEITRVSDYLFDITQTNMISMLIEANTEASEIIIDNLEMTHPTTIGKLTLFNIENPEDYRKKRTKLDEVEYTEEVTSINPVILQNESGNYIINFGIENQNCAVNQRLSESVTTYTYDAGILKVLGYDANTLKFDVSFDLTIIDTAGTKVKTRVTLKMPNDEIFTAGMSTLHQDVSKFMFSFTK